MSGQDAKSPPLQAVDLCCGFDRALVSDLSLALSPGQAVAFVGPNGAGKTTLLRTLAGSLPPLGGKVLVNGQDLGRLSGPDRARQLALLSQEGWGEESLTVRELVELGRTPYLGLWGRLGAADRDAVDHAIEACQLVELASHRLDRISGGERQRARIALTVAQQTSLLLLDEPVNHLDLRRRYEFYELITQLRRQRDLAVVFVLHDLAEAFREADTVMVISEGQAIPVPLEDPDRLAKLSAAFGVPEDRIMI